MKEFLESDVPDFIQEKLFFTDRTNRKRAYICSPLRADNPLGIYRNMNRARDYMAYAVSKMNYSAYAPHAYLPLLLDDSIPDERRLALWFGLKLLELCDVMLVCGNILSEGMRNEITHAAKYGKIIYVFDSSLFREVKQLVEEVDGDTQKVYTESEHPFLGSLMPDKKNDGLQPHLFLGG